MKVETEIKAGFHVSECNYEEWPSVYLMVSNYWLEISPEHYLIDASDARDKSICIIAFTSNDSNFFLVGDSFFRGFYSIHDDENDRIGFAPHSESTKSAPVFAKYLPTNSIELNFFTKYRKELLMALGAVLILAGCAVFVIELWPKIKKWYSGEPAKLSKTGLLAKINQLD